MSNRQYKIVCMYVCVCVIGGGDIIDVASIYEVKRENNEKYKKIKKKIRVWIRIL